jgi:hypothetical protein
MVIAGGAADVTGGELRDDCVVEVGSDVGSASDVSMVDGFMVEQDELGIIRLV